MKTRDKSAGSAWLPSLIGIVLLTLFVLVVFGEKPEDMLQIPVAIFNDLKSGFSSRSSPPTPATVSAGPVAAGAPNHPLQSAPSPFDWASLEASPAEWPKVVALKAPASFPVVVNGAPAGEARLPAGTQVKLVSLKNHEVTVEYQGGAKVLQAESTDLKERVLATRAQAGQ